MNANSVLLQRKYTRLVFLLSVRLNISLDKALEQFMMSNTYLLMREGIGDTHCLSDDYLLDELVSESKIKHSKSQNKKATD